MCVWVLCLFLMLGALPRPGLPSHTKGSPRGAGSSSGLVLTPYIEAGDVQKARRLSAVSGGPFSPDVPSYSGFFTVNKLYHSNMFFWFFPAQNNYKEAPVLLWLEGGPGTSGMFGLFNALGPYRLQQDFSLTRNPFTWGTNYSLMFVDNPIGTGYSYTDGDDGYAVEEYQIGQELYTMLIQFFKMFPELQPLPFYITGESYAGKFVPALGYAIHEHNPKAELKINLQGLIVGNGFTDPENMISYSNLVYPLGLVDTKTYQRMQILEEQCRQTIRSKNYTAAYLQAETLINTYMGGANFSSNFNFLHPDMQPGYSFLFMDFANLPAVRQALHVGNVTFSNGSVAFQKMRDDIMASVRPWLELMLDNYRVLYFSGQLDLSVAYHNSVNMYNKLRFRAAREYKDAVRRPWFVNGTLAGYVKTAGYFTEALVRNAGHVVDVDQPAWLLDLVTRFISNTL